jgi:ribosomal protein S21
MIVILKILNKTKIKINSLEKVLKILKKISHKNGL